VDAAYGSDLFICEAYFFEKKVKYHLDYKTLLARRSQLWCGRILLTHMNADMFSRLGELDLEWAEDGKEVLL
jgi:ribonuclease BN (tRNA processing enzyme)